MGSASETLCRPGVQLRQGSQITSRSAGSQCCALNFPGVQVVQRSHTVSASLVHAAVAHWPSAHEEHGLHTAATSPWHSPTALNCPLGHVIQSGVGDGVGHIANRAGAPQLLCHSISTPSHTLCSPVPACSDSPRDADFDGVPSAASLARRSCMRFCN